MVYRNKIYRLPSEPTLTLNSLFNILTQSVHPINVKLKGSDSWARLTRLLATRWRFSQKGCNPLETRSANEVRVKRVTIRGSRSRK